MNAAFGVNDCTGLRVGTDVESIAVVADAVEHFGARYLNRVYTSAEIDTCAGSADRLAARFAAKEATVKVLRPIGAAPDWREIEIVSEPGWPTVRLSGAAARSARQQGLTSFEVSLSHGAGIATATVVALVGPTTEFDGMR